MRIDRNVPRVSSHRLVDTSRSSRSGSRSRSRSNGFRHVYFLGINKKRRVRSNTNDETVCRHGRQSRWVRIVNSGCSDMS